VDGRYWNDEEQTQSVMKKDEHGTLWMHTGDEGIMDQEGYLQGEVSNQNQIWPVADILRSCWKDQGPCFIQLLFNVVS
jgi:acyl-CoA synthetase (AMP-forming)/AMP-acid ligase II